MIASVSASAPQQLKNMNYAMKIHVTPSPSPILLSHLRERRGRTGRGIFMDIGCMGISCAAIFMIKLDKNNLCTPCLVLK